MRVLIAIVPLLMLGGCWWTGPVFYKSTPTAAAPISDGTWAGTDADGKVSSHRIARYPNGAFGLGLGEEDDNSRLTFQPLPRAGRDLWITELTAAESAKDEAVYGLAERRGDTVALVPFLECEGNEDLVRKAGGKVEGDATSAVGEDDVAPKSGGPACIFSDAASLERALTAFAALHPALEDPIMLKRTGD